MKNYLKSITFFMGMLFCAAWVSAQTADEVIAKYIQAIGGKELLGKITSVYMESNLSVMGNETTMKTTLLNGKGYKQEMDMMGSTMINSITETGGWSINPMMGGSSAVDMPEAQYKSSKDQIYVGGIFGVYAEQGYKSEMIGNETVGTMNTVKVKMTAPDNTSSTYFFDEAAGYLVKAVQTTEMQGSMVDNVLVFSDYKTVEGYTLPHKMDMNIGGQFDLSITVTKVELNKPVDPEFFAKP